MRLFTIWNSNSSTDMSNFQESGISFKFSSPQWAVVKYDEHLAHKKVSNALQPTKAVDFLGIHDNRQLFLVEVKNYRGHTHDAETQEVINIFQDSPLGRCFRLQIYDFFSILQTVYRKKLNYRQYIIIYPAFRPY